VPGAGKTTTGCTASASISSIIVSGGKCGGGGFPKISGASSGISISGSSEYCPVTVVMVH
jgi:hypothetical protein